MTTVLIIDDEPAILEILSSLLKDEGYQVIIAADGKEGLRRLASSKPDIVLCDVMMPFLDGRTLCRTMQRDPLTSGVPVVLMSAVANIVSRTECGYAEFIHKPFDFEALLSTIANLLAPLRRVNKPVA